MKFIILLLLPIALLSCSNNRMKIISGLEGKPLPSFDLLLTDSATHLNTNNFPAGQPFVLFYFSPFCPYCQAETEAIKKEIGALKNMRLYFLSPFPLNEIKTFDNHYSLSKYRNITVAQIKDTALTYYRIQTVPYLAVYDTERKLKEVILGNVNIDILKQAAFSN